MVKTEERISLKIKAARRRRVWIRTLGVRVLSRMSIWAGRKVWCGCMCAGGLEYSHGCAGVFAVARLVLARLCQKLAAKLVGPGLL